jgi:hypothetical protein
MLIQIALQQPEMLPAIVRGTPVWVWGLLGGLVALGLTQTVSRRASRARVLVMPIAMTAMSLQGMVSAFGASGAVAGVLLAWAVSAALLVALRWRAAPPVGTRYDADAGRFHLPGSAVPLALILGIFLTKYAVSVELALQPALAGDAPFALTVAALYGVFSGFFAARTVALWRLTRTGHASPAAPRSVSLNQRNLHSAG